MNEELDICRHCGRPEDEHCAEGFEAVKVPVGCQCDPEDWEGSFDIPEVCDRFELDKFGTCKTCQHLEECHA